MTEQSIQAYQDDEISLLDIVVALAESWKLLVLGPLIAGGIACGLSFLWPKTFESKAIMRLTEEQVAMLHSPSVLNYLIRNFGQPAKVDDVMDEVRQDLKKRLIFHVDKKSKLAIITARGSSPDAAQVLGSNACAALLLELQVKGREKAIIEETIAINNIAIAGATDILDGIQLNLKKMHPNGLTHDLAVKNLTLVYSDIAKFSYENLTLKHKLEPMGEEVFVQRASLPQKMVAPKRGLVVLLAVLASGLVLLMWVLVRKAWQQAAKEAEFVEKLARIQAALGVRSS
jgi:LPS O-antigen subunit length determinant protein (WzzB/FepE family)